MLKKWNHHQHLNQVTEIAAKTQAKLVHVKRPHHDNSQETIVNRVTVNRLR